jgi:hypothetical protein
MSSSTRWLVTVAAVLVLVISTSAVAAVLAGGADELPEHSPEGTVQRYLRALADGEGPEALQHLSAEINARCGGELSPNLVSFMDDADLRASLQETSRRDATATVRVRLAESFDGLPFGGGESVRSLSFQLGEEGGVWRFTEPPWPIESKGRPFQPAPPAPR